MLNGTYLLENGRIDKYLFPKGYVKTYYFGNIGHRIKEHIWVIKSERV